MIYMIIGKCTMFAYFVGYIRNVAMIVNKEHVQIHLISTSFEEHDLLKSVACIKFHLLNILKTNK